MLDPLSLSAVPCSTHTSGGQRVDQATAFLYEAMDGQLHLVTNWHVVTSRNPEEPTKSRTAVTPETLRCLVHKRQRPDSRGQKHIRLSQLATVDVHLNSADGNNPAWREHPDFRHRVDVVALDVTDTFLRDVHAFNVVNQIKRFDKRFCGDVTDDVFVVGYPFGLSGSTYQPGALPLYKRGSIASEPSVSFGELPRLLIDCRTYKGMSGSPVVVAHRGMWRPDGEFSDNTVIGTVENLLGCYSGRLDRRSATASEGVSEIGVVWKWQAVEDVVERGVQGTTLAEMLDG